VTQVSHLRGIIVLVMAIGLFIASDTVSKFAFAQVPVFEVVALRAAAAALVCIALIIANGQSKFLKLALNPFALARGVCEVGANLGFTLGIVHLPLADVTAIAQTAPLLLLIGANVFYGERLGSSRIALIALGIAGAMLVAQPGSTAASIYALYGFLVAVSAAGRDLITRKVPTEIPALVVALAVLLVLTLAGTTAMLATETSIWPSPIDSLRILAAGLLMIGGHVGIYYAFKHAPARTLAPFLYALTIWAVLLGAIFFGEYPNALAIAGMVLIVTAGILVILLEDKEEPSRTHP
jgi:drug/metabolite transporter (DMT)-like permease